MKILYTGPFGDGSLTELRRQACEDLGHEVVGLDTGYGAGTDDQCGADHEAATEDPKPATDGDHDERLQWRRVVPKSAG